MHFRTSIPRSRLFALAALLLFAAGGAHAQRLIVYGVNNAASPVISAKVLLVSEAGRPLPLPDSLEVRERGTLRTSLGLTGCSDAGPRALSVSVVVNVRRHQDRAAAFLRRFVALLPTPESEMSITAGDREMIVLRNMTRDRAALLRTIDALPPMRYAWSAQLLNDSVAGGYAMLAGRSNRKVVVIVSETDPKVTPGEWMKLLPDSAGVVYVVNVGSGNGIGNGAANMRLQQQSASSPGWRRADVQDAHGAEEIAACIVGEQSGIGCELRWRTETACSADSIPTAITIPALSLSASAAYPPKEYGARLVGSTIAPFDGVAPGMTAERLVTLRATGGPIDIAAIRTSDPHFTVVADSLPPLPFHLARDSSRVIAVRYTPADSAWSIAALMVDAGSCSFEFPLAGGLHRHGVHWPAFRLTSPAGGEIFHRGTLVPIKWSGLSPQATVSIEQSQDDGRTWGDVTPMAQGGAYLWRAPDHAVPQCRVRVSALESPAVGTDVMNFAGDVAGSGFSNDGSLVAVTSVDRSRVGIVDVRDGKVLREFERHGFDNGGWRNDRMRWSPADHRLVTMFRGPNSASGVQIWDADAGTLSRQIVVPDTLFLDSASWGGRANRIAIVCTSWLWSRRYIELHDAASGAQVALVEVDPHCSIAWSPDGAYLLAVDPNTQVRSLMLIDAYSGVVLRRFNLLIMAAASQYYNYAMRPDNAQIVVWANAGRPLGVLDVETGKPLGPLAFGTTLTLPVWSPDGTKLAAVTPAGVSVVDATTNMPLFTLPWMTAMFGWSPNGRLLAVGDGRNMFLCDATSGMIVRTLVSASTANDPAVAWAFDGSALSFRLTNTQSAVWFLDSAALPAVAVSESFALIDPMLSFGPATVRLPSQRTLTGYTDTLLPAAVCNNGPIPITVQVNIQGAYRSSMLVIDGNEGVPLMPGTCRDVTVAFLPEIYLSNSETVQTAWLYTLTPSNHAFFMTEVTGTGIGFGGDRRNSWHVSEVDYGAVGVGFGRDTVVRVVLGSSAATDVTVQRVASDGPDSSAFELLEPRPPFTLSAADSIAMRIRFTPTAHGRLVTRFLFDVGDGLAPLRLRVSGIGGEGGIPPHADTPAAPTVEIYPNIVHASTTVQYGTTAPGRATLELFDLLGHRIAILADKEVDAGVHGLPLNAEALASGIYIVRLRTDAGQATAWLQVYR